MATGAQKKETPKNSGLKKCFAALVDRKQVNLDLDVLGLMLKHELHVNTDDLDENLSKILPFMLVLYIRNWPGWQRSKEFYSGKLSFREWYEKFRQYIVVRLNYLVKNGYNQALEMMKTDKNNEYKRLNPDATSRNHTTQTDYLVPKVIAPFSLSIQCPPKILNSLVFTDAGDDIHLKYHDELPWPKLSLLDLLNWPHVGVEFMSPEFSFSRFNRSEYIRYLNLTNSPIVPEKRDFIEQVEILDPTNLRSCYTLKLLKSYSAQYLDVITAVDKVTPRSIDDFAIIIEEFFNDIEEIEMNNTMASNTSVLFNIGRCSFLRNKKIAKNHFITGPKAEVGYCEKYIPKMEIQLHFFKGIQDTSTEGVTFSYLNILRKALALNPKAENTQSSVPVLRFHCLFCKTSYSSSSDMLKHLETEHKMEPNFLCTRCRKSFPITTLTKCRWKHACKQTGYGLGPK